MMWFLLLLLHTAHIELVTPQALILRNRQGRGPCEGHLEVYYKNIWGYVGASDWSENTEKVVCKSTHCGEPVENSTIDIFSESRTILLNELKCKGNEESLLDCDYPGWNASVYQELTVKKVKCSSNITISLEGSKCAGAVKFSDGKTSGYFCKDGWNEKVASFVCESLGCGGVRISSLEQMESEAIKNSKIKMKLNCSAFHNQNPDHLWQCVTGQDSTCQPAAVICNDRQRLQLKGNRSNVCSGRLEVEENGAWVSVTRSKFTFDVCQQMHCGTTPNVTQTNSNLVTCSDKVNVVLRDSQNSKSKCYGRVNIEVNGSVKPVCGSSWEEKEAELVCKELNCGKLIYSTKETLNAKGAMNHVNCSGSESSLWHCQAQHGEHVQCSTQPKIVCSDSVKVKLMDGPGGCAGRLAIELEGQWGRVANTSWTQSDTVCKQLKCGQHGKPDKFSQGSDKFLSINCADKSDMSNISECLTADSNKKSVAQEVEAVGITCDDHKMVFLGGPEACSGQVKIHHREKIYWLSGSNATWNNESANTVCRQMHCGSASSFSSESAEGRRVWNDSLKCSSPKESLFDCSETKPPPPDRQNSTASVICSGKIEMKLTKGCSGKVKIYTQEVQGDMCADTWTQEMSKKLCTELRCGKALTPHSSPRDGDIKFSSLHAPLENSTLTQWNFVKTQDNDQSCNQRPAYVVCSGSVKPRFSTSIEKCSGNIEMEFEGQWLPVCSTALEDTKIQNTICQELKCGGADKLLRYFGPAPAGKRFISSLTCPQGAKNSSECTIATSQRACEQYSGLQCSVPSVLDWKAMVPVGKKSCSGQVFIFSGKGKSAVSGEGWTKTEKKTLCHHINCSPPLTGTQVQGIEMESFWNKSFSCSNNSSKNIWECEKETAPSKNNKLLINCQGEPSVTLSQNCSGELRIDGTHVCADNWDLSYANKVCQQSSCGNAISFSGTQLKAPSDTYYVSCDDYHSFLGQCRRIRGKCDKGVVISCTDSVKFRTTEQHGGKLEVKYRDKWEKACFSSSLSDEIKASLCEATTKAEYPSDSNINNQGSAKIVLECPEGYKDVRRCVKQGSCSGLQDTITCIMTAPTPTQPTTAPPSVASIIVGVLLLILVLILIVLFIRFFIRRARKSRDSSRMLSTKDMEFESGEYEDVMDKENEMEEFSHGRLRSEDEFITENDGHSVSSLPYDDIDEADNPRPLTSPGPAAPAGQDINMREDGVTYEVEDPQESYDDIDTIHETTQTKAEVHDSPQTTQDTAAPPGLAQRDEDYLEPDQDG